MDNVSKEILKFYTQWWNADYKSKWLIILLTAHFVMLIVCLFGVVFFIVWSISYIIFIILYSISMIIKILDPILTVIHLWICKRLVDLNCYPLLSFLNNTKSSNIICHYTKDQGNVILYLKLMPINIKSSIISALIQNKYCF